MEYFERMATTVFLVVFFVQMKIVLVLADDQCAIRADGLTYMAFDFDLMTDHGESKVYDISLDDDKSTISNIVFTGLRLIDKPLLLVPNPDYMQETIRDNGPGYKKALFSKEELIQNTGDSFGFSSKAIKIAQALKKDEQNPIVKGTIFKSKKGESWAIIEFEVDLKAPDKYKETLRNNNYNGQVFDVIEYTNINQLPKNDPIIFIVKTRGTMTYYVENTECRLRALENYVKKLQNIESGRVVFSEVFGRWGNLHWVVGGPDCSMSRCQYRRDYKRVTFTSAFEHPPLVFAAVTQAFTRDVINVGVSDVTTQGFTLAANTPSDWFLRKLTVSWMALPQASGGGS